MQILTFTDILIVSGILLVALVTIGIIVSRLYKRASKEVSFVRTGMGGQKVITNGGSLVFPVLHEIIPVNMNTVRLEVQRSNEQALITRDRMRVDVLAEFYVRVQPTIESIAAAAQTLGLRTLHPDALKELVEGKFVDALRAVAAEMAMEELHEQRVDFVQQVQTVVSEDLLKNGLELESVSLTGLDQTNRDHFNPDNAFDAAGLTKLTDEIETLRKRRNEIERETQVAIDLKNLETDRQKLEIARDQEYAKLEQEREVEIRRAAQMAEIAGQQAAKKREAEEGQITASQSVELTQIDANRSIEEGRIEKERQVKERDIARSKSIETAEIDREKSIELASQDREIAIAEKSKDKSVAEAEAEADRARALAVEAEETVVTVRDTAQAERAKAVDLVEARRGAERDAIEITVAATARMNAAEDESAAIRTLAEAEAEKIRAGAQGEADAEKLRVAAAELRYAVEAAGREALNQADNTLTADIVDMKVKLAIVEHLRDIIRESVRPLENIDGIKIIQVDGLTGNGSGGAANSGGGGTGLADQVVASALRYRSQAPLIDALMKEIGLSGADLAGLAGGLSGQLATGEDTAPAADGSDAE